MLRVLFHVAVLPAMLWLERRYGPKLSPSRNALVWYLLGMPLIAIEASASAGPDRLVVALQSLVVALFYVPPAYFAFRFAQKGAGTAKAFLLYVALAVIATAAAGLFLARAPFVAGFVIGT